MEKLEKQEDLPFCRCLEAMFCPQSIAQREWGKRQINSLSQIDPVRENIFLLAPYKAVLKPKPSKPPSDRHKITATPWYAIQSRCSMLPLDYFEPRAGGWCPGYPTGGACSEKHNLMTKNPGSSMVTLDTWGRSKDCSPPFHATPRMLSSRLLHSPFRT